MKKLWIDKLAGTTWSGKGELWIDPNGNDAILYDCKLNIEANAIFYSWIYENETRQGRFTFNDKGAVWVDSWHQPNSVQCVHANDSWSIFNISNTYEVPNNPDWGWQSKLSERPDGSLVLQMTNIAPWGEDSRAVRMLFTRE